ncbi:hydroxylase [Gordonia sp. LSe1-13]|uniref:Hydroxylase n=1 Tax=Gordonia sesuvii TaxID=3116777 RepID=A0ABU7M9L1_9ACTN|nr:hydroxylase [Gordonia sp. LSe1-13]
MTDPLSNVLQFADEIREQAVEGERITRLTDTNAKRIREAGVIRMLQPKEFGGLESTPREFAETVMGIGAVDGSTGWVSGIVGVHPWALAFFDDDAQKDVWGQNPDVWMASPYAPMGVARPVEGGYRLTGRWLFSTGNDHCDWVMTAAMVGDDDGNPITPPRSIYVLVPKSDYTVDHDSWNVVGLRGTGSKDFSITDAFVPSHRTIESNSLLEGNAWKEKGREEPLYRFPFSCIFPLGITSSLIGIAEGTLACYLNAQRDRVAVSGVPIKDDPYVLSNIGAAAAEIAASRAAMLENVDRFWDLTNEGKEATFEQRAVGRRTQTAAAWRAVRAVDEIFARAGGNSLQLSLPLQRFWRDAHAGLAHAIHVPGSIFHASTLTEMGGDPQGPMRIMI